MKKLFTVLLIIAICISTSSVSFAGEIVSGVEYSKYSVEKILKEIEKLEVDEEGNTIYTEKFIKKYGIIEIDENGEEIIVLPIAKDEVNITPPVVSEIHDIYEVHHELPELDDNLIEVPVILPMHYSPTGHVHRIENINTYTWIASTPLTLWADEGFTVMKYYYQSGTLSVSMSLGGGITVDQCESFFGIELGGSYTVGEGEQYSAVVPQGYEGRISYRSYSYYYDFDTYTDYYLGGFLYYTVINSSYAISEPYDGLIYLELRSK